MRNGMIATIEVFRGRIRDVHKFIKIKSRVVSTLLKHIN